MAVRRSGIEKVRALWVSSSCSAWPHGRLPSLVFSAGNSLASAIDASTGSARIDAYEALAWRLFVSATLVGVALRVASYGVRRHANWYIDKQSQISSALGKASGELAVSIASLTFVWDDLLARLHRSTLPQLVHVRFLDGSEAFGILAEGGRADFQADGRGIVLASELIHRDGQLVPVANSSGLFIAPEAVASVGFIEYLETPSPTQ